MELYVQKELKDRCEPLEEQMIKQQEITKELKEKVSEQQTQISTIDKHYNGVSKALLSRHGIILTEISEFNILKELRRQKEKEDNAKARIKREKITSLSPENTQHRCTEYVIKLAKNARDRQRSKHALSM